MHSRNIHILSVYVFLEYAHSLSTQSRNMHIRCAYMYRPHIPQIRMKKHYQFAQTNMRRGNRILGRNKKL